MPRALVLHGACDIISAYPSEEMARAGHELLPGRRALVTETARAKTEAAADFVLLRAAEAEPGAALTAPTLCYDASLLRTAAQKLVRRQMGGEAATVALQYLRQLVGAKGANEERKKILERMVIVAAEDAGVISSLSIGVFHILGATSPEIGFGANDAFAIASCYGALALAPRPSQFEALEDEPDGSSCEPEAWATMLALRLMAKRVARARKRLEAEWLRKLEGSFRTQGLPPPPPAAAPLQLGSNEPLPPGCRPYVAVDFHNPERAVELYAALRKAVPLAKDRSDNELKKVLKPHALLNLRDHAKHGVYHKLTDNKPLPSHAEGSWEAQVLAAWPTVAARFWEPAQAAAPRKRSAGEGSSAQPQKKQMTLPFAPST